MPSRPEHEARAEHNERLYAHLRVTAPNAFLDWETTSLFYAAVHLVEALLATINLHPMGHQERLELASVHLKAGYHPYRQLEELSQRARYNAKVQITSQEVAEALACFRRVRDAIVRELP